MHRKQSHFLYSRCLFFKNYYFFLLGNVEALIVLDNSDASFKKNYELITCLHTLNANERDYQRILKNGN